MKKILLSLSFLVSSITFGQVKIEKVSDQTINFISYKINCWGYNAKTDEAKQYNIDKTIAFIAEINYEGIDLGKYIIKHYRYLSNNSETYSLEVT
ncbi:hypothetical protein AB4865_08680 [Capnocytophaga sp. ARDL2]|uniref:hypothetical protein n=1 Tax=Capnocytophaga sp. ARDL2 TaxID=3238809 RepID=UPI0035577CA2